MKLVSLLTIAALAGTVSLSAAEKYESPGFSAEIGGSGEIRHLKFAGMPLADSIGITGSYELPPGTEKYDSRFFQAWDYSNKAQFKREGTKLAVTVDSTFSNTKLKNAAAYKVVCTLEPEKITFSCEVTQKTALQSSLRIFSSHMLMPPSLFGRGVKVLTRNGQEEFKVLPETYNPKFRLDGRSFSLSTEKGILTLSGGKDVTFSFMDSRMWGGKGFSLIANPFGKWTPKPVTHPAGTVWKWDYTLTFQPE